MTKDFSITKVKSSGKILLQFKTIFVFNDDWSLKSQTVLEQFGWLQKPEVALGILSVPITLIVDETLSAKKDLLCKAIDDQVRQLKLADHFNTMTTSLANPINLPFVGDLWWSTSPIETFMHPLKVEDKNLEVTLGLKSKLKIGFGVPLEKKALEIKAPNFTSNKRKPSQLNTEILVAYSTIQKALNENLAGQVFEVESYKIGIKNYQRRHSKALLLEN